MGQRLETSRLEEPAPQPLGKRSSPKRLTRRADFLAAAKGKRFHVKGFTLQSAPRKAHAARDEAESAPRFGFTVTKKLGRAVLRNRIRRRLKEALRGLEPLPARPSHDYVIVARPEALGMDFSALQAELLRALEYDQHKGSPIARRK